MALFSQLFGFYGSDREIKKLEVQLLWERQKWNVARKAKRAGLLKEEIKELIERISHLLEWNSEGVIDYHSFNTSDLDTLIDTEVENMIEERIRRAQAIVTDFKLPKAERKENAKRFILKRQQLEEEMQKAGFDEATIRKKLGIALLEWAVRLCSLSRY